MAWSLTMSDSGQSRPADRYCGVSVGRGFRAGIDLRNLQRAMAGLVAGHLTRAKGGGSRRSNAPQFAGLPPPVASPLDASGTYLPLRQRAPRHGTAGTAAAAGSQAVIK